LLHGWGYRKAKDPYQAYVVNKGSAGREEKLIHLSPASEAALVRYVRTERARVDPHGRKRLADLDDGDPLFLTRRGTPYRREAFYHHWRSLYASRPSPQAGGLPLASLEFTPHDIRHLRVTEWLSQIKTAENPKLAHLLRRGVQRRMAWRSPLTLFCYDHSFTEREEEEAFDAFQRQVEHLSAGVVPVQNLSLKRAGAEGQQAPSLGVQRVLDDLAFWEDES
jgi:integrase